MLYKRGAATTGQIEEAKLKVQEVDLELCETSTKRIAALEAIVSTYKPLEKRSLETEKPSGATSGKSLEITLKRLDAQIALEREKIASETIPRREKGK